MAKFDKIKGSDSGFKIPKDYFDHFSIDIQTKISEEILKEKFGNKNPFTVPKGYFENLIPQSFKKQGNKIISLLKPYISIAAGIILLAGIWQIVVTNFDMKRVSKTIVDSLNNKDSLYADFVIDFDKIKSNDLKEKADVYIEQMDNETVISISETFDDNLATLIDNESIYEYFVDYDSGMDYIDYITEKQTENTEK